MKVLITGGAGFIGSHLAEHLLAAGSSVRVLDNLSTGKRENLPVHQRLVFVQGDIRDRSLVTDTARGMDAIVAPGCGRLVQASVDDPLARTRPTSTARCICLRRRARNTSGAFSMPARRGVR